MCVIGMQSVVEQFFTIIAGISPGKVALLIFTLSRYFFISQGEYFGVVSGGISGSSISSAFTSVYSLLILLIFSDMASWCSLSYFEILF